MCLDRVNIDSFLIAFVVEMVKLIWTFHGQTFHGRTFSGQDVSFPDVSGLDKSVTGRFVGESFYSSSVPFRPTKMRTPNLALVATKLTTVRSSNMAPIIALEMVIHCKKNLRDSFMFVTKPPWDWANYSRPGRVW